MDEQDDLAARRERVVEHAPRLAATRAGGDELPLGVGSRGSVTLMPLRTPSRVCIISGAVATTSSFSSYASAWPKSNSCPP
jgi:hypothetical protein